MNKLKLLLSLSLFAVANVSFAQEERVLSGYEASQLVKGASKIRYESSSIVPTYLRFEQPYLDVNQASDYLRNTFGLSADFGLSEINVTPDKLGYTHYRMRQTHKGIPIEGSMYMIHVKDNKIESFSGDIFNNASISTSPSLSERGAIGSALSYVDANVYMWDVEGMDVDRPVGQLVIVPFKGDYEKAEFRLAWKIDVYVADPMSRTWTYVDAHTGEVIWQEERIHTADTPGTAATKYSGSQTIIADSYSGQYRLKEVGRGGGVQTRNKQGSGQGSPIDITDSDNNWTNTSGTVYLDYATDAHFAAEKCYDYYMNIHNRNSYNGNGAILNIYMNVGSGFNAYWDGSSMNYLNGSSSNGNKPLTALDVGGHEMTHGVVQSAAGLQYSYQSGALNESFADIFGTALEFYANINPDWTMGEDFNYVIRNMQNPNQYQQPDTYQGQYWYTSSGDNGGVHTNSGVQNFWFYLLVTGGSGTNDLGNAYNVTGIGMTKASAIAYRNLDVYMTPTSQYADARFYGVQAAEDLYGGCSPEMSATAAAWYAVGVGTSGGAAANANFTASPTSWCTVPVTVAFTSTSSGATNYNWDFGDGGTSTQQNPTHTYTTLGNYTVALAISGACGSDTETKNNFISLSSSNQCVATMPPSGSASTAACTGTLLDPGGTSNYADNVTSTYTINGSGPVTLTFNSFNTEQGYDYLTIYDGATTASPQLANLHGTSLPSPITSSGNSITLRFTSDGGVVAPGFSINWQCGSGGGSCGIPTNVSATNVTTSGATVSWAAVSGAGSYVLQYKEASAGTWQSQPVSGTSYAITGLTASTTYNYKVNAVCSGTNGPSSTTQNFTTAGSGGSCSAPTGLSSSAITATSATVSWGAVGGASAYNLEYKLSTASTWTPMNNITGTSQNLTGLTASSTYNFRVYAVCSGGVSPVSTTANFTTTSSGGGGSCGIPGNIAALPAATSAVISWDPVGGATSYSLQYKLTTTTSWTTASSNAISPFTIPNLTANTTYNYRLRAICGTNIGTYSTTANFTTTSSGGGGSCGTPTNLASSGITASSAMLSWAAVAGATNYNLEYKVSTASAWTPLSVGNVTTYNLTGLAASTSYNYKVTAVCGGNTGTASTVAAFTTTASGGGGSCGTPTGLTSTPAGTSAAVSWTAVSGATTYNVQYRTGTGAWVTVGPISAPTVNASLTPLTPTTIYEFQVRANCGNIIGSWSASASFTTTSSSCGTPSGLSSANVTSSSADVSWASVGGATSYTLQYKPLSASTWTTLTNVTSPSSITGLTASTAYVYQVKAVCNGTDGPYSAIGTFSTLAGTSGCGDPINLSAITTSTSATITCDPVTGATAYILQHRPNGGSSWTTVMVQGNLLNETITGLAPGTAYEYQIYAVCNNVLSNSALSTFTTDGGTGGGGGVCQDTYEANNSSSTAKPATVNQDLTASINPMGDTDWFSFQNTANQPNVQVLLTNLPADYQLIVYKPNGGYVASINSGTNPESVVINNAAIGTYYARIYGSNGANSPSCYTLRPNISNVAFRLAEPQDQELTIYPNPTTGMLTIPVLKYQEIGEDNVSITVMNQIGKRVFEMVATENSPSEVNMDLSDLPDGIYNILISVGDYQKVERIVIAH